MILGLLAALLISNQAQVDAVQHDVRFVGGARIDEQTYSYYPGSSDVVVFVHGGGWISGSRNDLPGWMVNFQDEGWTVASVDYTLGNVPQAIVDVKVAIEQVRSDLHPHRIVLAGWSAGTHLILSALQSGMQVDGMILAGIPFKPIDYSPVSCHLGHAPLYVIQGAQDAITPWDSAGVTQCRRTGSVTVALVTGEHDPSASVNNESLVKWIGALS